MPERVQKVAIIGGGVAGLYAAYRLLRQSEIRYDITLFESGPRLGGRICSQEIPGISFRAELGAMRFPTRHLLLTSLIDDLKIKTSKFNVGSLKLYIRGHHLTSKELIDGNCHQCRGDIPYRLRKEERGQSPGKLVEFAIRGFLNDLTFSTADSITAHFLKSRVMEEGIDCVPEYWPQIRDVGRYHGIPLHNIGFWNLLQHYLSNEAIEYIHASMGLDSVLGNWSVAVAIPWFLADFGLDTYHMIPGGTERMSEELIARIGRECIINKNRCVVRAKRHEGHWHLWHGRRDGDQGDGDQGDGDHEKIKENIYDFVVLAVSRSALERIEVEGIGNDWPPQWLAQVRSHRLFKLFLLYEDAWWKGIFEPDDTGRIFTDLPLRQIFYFGPKWMKGHGGPASVRALRGTDQWGLIMASYSDEHSASFWHSPDLSDKTEAEQEEYYGCPYYREPLGLSEEDEKELRRPIPLQLRARERTVRKIHKLLQEIHDDIEVPDPILGVFKDWGDQPYGGGWHTWDIGTKPWGLKNRPKVSEGLFVCGEAYSDEQGWIEGALKSVELVLGSLDVSAPPWWLGSGDELRDYIRP
jgi:hypothetical protein